MVSKYINFVMYQLLSVLKVDEMYMSKIGSFATKFEIEKFNGKENFSL